MWPMSDTAKLKSSQQNQKAHGNLNHRANNKMKKTHNKPQNLTAKPNNLASKPKPNRLH